MSSDDTSQLPPIRNAAIFSIAGAIIMAIGAATIFSTGSDPFLAFQAEAPEDIAMHLADVHEHQGQVVAGLVIWVFGVPVMGMGLTMLARHGVRPTWSSVARTAAIFTPAASVILYSAMIAYVVAFAPAAAEDGAAAMTSSVRALGVFVDTADWLATFFILGVATSGAIFAGTGGWAPRWLTIVGGVNLAVAALSLVLVALGQFGPAIVIVPVGEITVVAAGVAAIRHGRASALV